MNSIRFDVRPGRECETMVVVPVVDGVDLATIMKPIENPFAKIEGHSGLAGQYDGIRIDRVPRFRDYLLGLADDLHQENGKTALLGCTCGEEGCWPLLARIEVNENRVSWSEFEQPQRGPESKASYWKYDQAPVFVFSLQEYEAAASRLLKNPTPSR